jgi:hypothetical protein
MASAGAKIKTGDATDAAHRPPSDQARPEYGIGY